MPNGKVIHSPSHMETFLPLAAEVSNAEAFFFGARGSLSLSYGIAAFVTDALAFYGVSQHFSSVITLFIL
jgi:hypothetical protein